ncbi:MAG TPA: DUF1844 domain-containing protein [Candidatus Acidoferrales bacterium]
MTDAKHDESFKVIDRRHFTETGDLREGVIEQEKREEEAAKKAAEARAKTAAKHGGAGGGSTSSLTGAKTQDVGKYTGAQETEFPAAASGGAVLGEAEEMETPAGEAVPASRSFQMLVDFLTRNAAAMLGGMADPRTGQTFLDLEGAREIIDMLDMLREKTLGRLSKEDDQLLLEVLGSLKLTFMEISKAATEQMAKKAKTK